MAFAMIFPGQGSQSLGMMNGFAELAVVKQTFEEASDCLGQDFWQMLNGETPDEINRTVNTQPLMLTAGVAVFRAWREAGGALPDYFAGHSLGEWSALVAAESLSFAQALPLVRLRAQAMQAAVPEGVGAMAAILGLDDGTLSEVCALAAEEEVVSPVNLNAPGQIVIAGHKTAVERAMALAKSRGAKRALLLPVSAPSHCALMKPAAEELASALASVAFAAPSIPVIHNADVAEHRSSDEIRDILVKQLYQPVRWTETIARFAQLGITLHVESAPGKVLAGLGKRIDSRVNTLALTDAAQLSAALEHVNAV